MASSTETIERCARRGEPIPRDLLARLRAIFRTRSADPEVFLKALEEQTERTETEYSELLKANAYDDLSCFVEFFTPDEPPADHHEFLCEHLMAIESRDMMRLFVSMHPGAAKSKFCSKYFPAWYVGRNPFHRWLHGGHSQIFVENEFGKPVRDLVADPRYAEIFPDAIYNPRSTAAGNWRLMNGRGGYVCKGVGQKIAGYRGHCGGGDDLIGSREDAHSPTIRDKVWNWLWTDFRTRFLPAAPIFLIATRWHVDDPAGRIEKLNQEKRGIPWTMLNLNALIENEVEMALDPMGRDIGEALWADFYSREILLDLKQTLPEMDWYALYKGRPTVTEGTMVKSAWFKRYIEYPRNRVTPEGHLMSREVRRTTLSVDTANKPGARNNSTALTVWVESMEGYHYLVHAKKTQVDYNGLIPLIEDTAREWGVQAIIVEEMGNGLTYVQQRSGKAPAPVIGIKLNRNESKEMRFESVLPIFQSGVVLLPKSAPWLHEFEDEILQFPDGASDDYADATSQYLTWSQVKRRLGTQKLTGTAHK